MTLGQSQQRFSKKKFRKLSIGTNYFNYSKLPFFRIDFVKYLIVLLIGRPGRFLKKKNVKPYYGPYIKIFDTLCTEN